MSKTVETLVPAGGLTLLLENTLDYAHANGICLRSAAHPDSSRSADHAPFSLLPSPFPNALFKKAHTVQEHFNELYTWIAMDTKFLLKSLTDLRDDFTCRLVDILEKVREEGCDSKDGIFLNIQRADYMVHVGADGTQELKQVEVNTVACSFAGLASKVLQMHACCLGNTVATQLPPTDHACDLLADGMVRAHHEYGVQGSAILFVVDDPSRNVFDQRHLEYSVRRLSDHTVEVYRLTLLQAHEKLKLTDDKRLIYADFDTEISIVYYRAGYDPADYKTEKAWDVRLLIERSLAVKVPSIAFHLAGAKKIQQVLVEPGAVEQYLREGPVAQKVRSTFVTMHSLESPAAQKLVADGAKHFVLKPQREGGGNNVYGSDIPKFVTGLAKEDHSAYILMERIYPPVHKAYLIRPDVPEDKLLKPVDSISEFGSFGFTLGNSKYIKENESGGFLLRTKSVGTDEGGVATGASVLDTPFLV